MPRFVKLFITKPTLKHPSYYYKNQSKTSGGKNKHCRMFMQSAQNSVAPWDGSHKLLPSTIEEVYIPLEPRPPLGRVSTEVSSPKHSHYGEIGLDGVGILRTVHVDVR